MSLTDQPTLPTMHLVHQKFSVPPAIDVATKIGRQWNTVKQQFKIASGARVALGVGSRGIAGLVETVRTIVGHLKAAGAQPFIIPAMGSHGGATAEGQIRVLADLGVTEKTVGAPVSATMAVCSLGEVDGIPLFLNRLASEADRIVLINRVKPHTDFSGPTESGIIKMMAIGLGCRTGADCYHRLAVVRDMYEIINRAGMALIERTNFLFGVGLVENQKHRICSLKIATADMLPQAEEKLLLKARQYFPKLPLNEIDLLIIDEIGKDISGAGMDPNVTGRLSSLYVQKPSGPNVSRIFVRDLTEASDGNAIGIGDADFATSKLVAKIDPHKTAMNCITSCGPESGRIPLTYDTDRAAIAAALTTIRPYRLEDLKIVHIKNTMRLETLMVSQGCLVDLDGRTDVFTDPDPLQFEFDSSDNLISRLK